MRNKLGRMILQVKTVILTKYFRLESPLWVEDVSRMRVFRFYTQNVAFNLNNQITPAGQGGPPGVSKRVNFRVPLLIQKINKLTREATKFPIQKLSVCHTSEPFPQQYQRKLGKCPNCFDGGITNERTNRRTNRHLTNADFSAPCTIGPSGNKIQVE